MKKGFFARFGDGGPDRRKSYMDAFPWFAIAKWKDGRCTEVFMTESWEAYTDEWYQTMASGTRMTVWCGTYREVDDFRKCCQSGRQ